MTAEFRERLFAAAAFFVPLMIFVFSAVPDVGLWDTGEMDTVPYIFGIAHPTGFPLYIDAGWLWTHVAVFGNVAWRMAVLSALCGAGACYFLYRAARFYTAAVPALSASLIFALGTVMWTRSTRAEVHIPALCIEAFIIVLAEFVRRGSLRAYFALPAAIGAGLAVHPVVIWSFPGAVLLAASGIAGLAHSRRSAALRQMLLGTFAGAAIIVAAYGGIAARSAFLAQAKIDPTLRLGFAAGMPFWDYGHPSTPANFLWFISGKQFGAHDALLSAGNLARYPAAFVQEAPSIFNEFGAAALIAAALGVIALLRRDRLVASAYLLPVLLPVPFAALYHIEIDSDRYLLLSFWALSFFCAAGLHAGMMYAASSPSRFRRGAQALILILAILLPANILARNWSVIAQRHAHEGRDVVRRVMQQTEDTAVIITPWVYATPLAYAAYVEGSLGHRTVVTGDLPDLVYRYRALVRRHPLYLIDDAALPFAAAPFTLHQLGDDFPRLVRVERPAGAGLILHESESTSKPDRLMPSQPEPLNRNHV